MFSSILCLEWECVRFFKGLLYPALPRSWKVLRPRWRPRPPADELSLSGWLILWSRRPQAPCVGTRQDVGCALLWCLVCTCIVGVMYACEVPYMVENGWKTSQPLVPETFHFLLLMIFRSKVENQIPLRNALARFFGILERSGRYLTLGYKIQWPLAMFFGKTVWLVWKDQRQTNFVRCYSSIIHCFFSRTATQAYLLNREGMVYTRGHLMLTEMFQRFLVLFVFFWSTATALHAVPS